MTLPCVVLKPSKDKPVRNHHPWVFSGAIGRMQGEVVEGEVVAVYAHTGELLGHGHYAPGSIAVRMLSFGPEAAGIWENIVWTSEY